MSGPTTVFWKRCSSCKNAIGFERIYWVCNVSTCNRKRTGLVFCTVSCWDAHLPVMRHRESWSEERRSPSRAEWEREQAEEAAQVKIGVAKSAKPASGGDPNAAAREPRRILVAPPPAAPANTALEDTLVVVSRLKAYVKARGDMNTSDGVIELLSERLRTLCDEAIRRARKEGRKTVMERDF